MDAHLISAAASLERLFGSFLDVDTTPFDDTTHSTNLDLAALHDRIVA